MKWLSIICLLSTCVAHAALFVSLGSHCEVTVQLIHNNLRVTAFPFDWVTTLNHERFLSILEDDFVFYMDPYFLNWDLHKRIVHTKYNIDFRHDFPSGDFETDFPKVKEKYERRIQRFRQLNTCAEKVYFLRVAFDFDLDSHATAVTRQSTAINHAQAQALRDLLIRKFPTLDFTLIIINYAEEQVPPIVDLDKVLEFKVRKAHRLTDYAELFRRVN